MDAWTLPLIILTGRTATLNRDHSIGVERFQTLFNFQWCFIKEWSDKKIHRFHHFCSPLGSKWAFGPWNCLYVTRDVRLNNQIDGWALRMMNSILGMVFCHRRCHLHWTLHYSPTLIAWSGSDVAVTSPSVNPEPERMVENKRLWGPNLVDGGEESWEREATEREKRWRSGKIERATSVRGETRTKSQRMRRRHQEATEREGTQGKGIAMYLMQIQSPSSWLNWRSL